VELILSAMQLADHPGDGLARFHVSHSPLATDFDLKPENDSNARSNQESVRLGASNIRKRLVNEGYGPVVESFARRLIAQATKRETLRLQQLVRAAYDRTSDPIAELRPSHFVEYVREEVKISGQNSARVRVMTIHRSKGLEFDAVVLPYQLSSRGWSGLTPSVVVGRESPTAPIDVATRYLGADKRALLPKDFRKLFDDDRQQNVREAMCVLYVMLTRAKHAVHIIVSHGAKADHKSPAGVLMATLADGKREEGVLFENGDEKWHRSQAQKDNSDDQYNLQIFYLPGQIRLQTANISRELKSKRGLPKILPSLVSEGDQVDLKRVFESWSNVDSLERGRILHGCFEKLIWADEGMPRHATLQQHLHNIAPAVRDFQPFLDDFYRLLEPPKIKSLFSRRGYLTNYMALLLDDSAIGTNRVEVCTERRFAVALENGFLQGVIDRLVLIYRDDQLIAADIVDIKTDRFEPEQLHERISRYRPQMQAYRMAAAKFLDLSIEKISTRLVFVEASQIVNLHAFEGSIDYSTKKRRPLKRSVKPPEESSAPKSPTQNRPKTPHQSLKPTQDKQSDSTGAQTPGAPVQRTLWD
jgi:ATP-dependent exoDNAse (exonuclease V) beta subunit